MTYTINKTEYHTLGIEIRNTSLYVLLQEIETSTGETLRLEFESSALASIEFELLVDWMKGSLSGWQKTREVHWNPEMCYVADCVNASLC